MCTGRRSRHAGPISCMLLQRNGRGRQVGRGREPARRVACMSAVSASRGHTLTPPPLPNKITCPSVRCTLRSATSRVSSMALSGLEERGAKHHVEKTGARAVWTRSSVTSVVVSLACGGPVSWRAHAGLERIGWWRVACACVSLRSDGVRRREVSRKNARPSSLSRPGLALSSPAFGLAASSSAAVTMPRRSARPPTKRARSPSPLPTRAAPPPPTHRRGGTPAAALAPTPTSAPALPKPVSLARTAGPALAPSTATGAFVPLDFAAAASSALATLRAAVGGCRPLDAATALAAAGLVTPPPRPTRVSRAPPRASETHAASRGPGGGRPLRPGRDILITVSISDAGKPAKPALDAVFVAGEGVTWRKVVEAAPCPTPAALARLGHRGTGAYVAMEGEILVDSDALRAGGADYAAPLLALLASAGVAPPQPPARPAPEAGPLRGRPTPAEGTAWKTGDWGATPLAASTLRCGGGGGGACLGTRGRASTVSPSGTPASPRPPTPLAASPRATFPSWWRAPKAPGGGGVARAGANARRARCGRAPTLPATPLSGVGPATRASSMIPGASWRGTTEWWCMRAGDGDRRREGRFVLFFGCKQSPHTHTHQSEKIMSLPP